MTNFETNFETNEQQTEKKYSSETLNKLYSMAAILDNFFDPYNAANNWGWNFYTYYEGDAEERKRYFAELMPGAKCLYNDAMKIIDGLTLKTKEIKQIIVLYYFLNENKNPLEKGSLSDDGKEDLIYLAGLVDAFTSSSLQNEQPKEMYKRQKTYSEKYFFLLCIFEAFLEVFEDDDKKPNIPAGSKIILEFTDDTPIKLPHRINITGKESAAQPVPIFIKAEATETITGEAHGETLDRLQMGTEFTGSAHIEAAQPRQLELPFLPPISPRYYVMPNNALANDLENPNKLRINYGAYDLSVFGDKSEITAYIAISYEPDPESGITIKGQDRLTAYERTVSNAIVSLWEAALKEGQTKPVISPEMIYRAMPGGGDKLSRGQKSAIVKTINKFRILHIEINATEEMQKRKVIGPKESFVLDSNYLLTTHAQYRAQNGRTVHAYRIEAEPIILTYSKAAKQLLSIPAKYLDVRQVKAGKITDKPIRMNEDRQAVTDYLLRRIAIMKRDAQNKVQRQSHNILFEEIYRTAGQENKPRDQKKELRNFCFDVLEYQTAAGNIKGFNKLKEGREIAKIEILL